MITSNTEGLEKSLPLFEAVMGPLLMADQNGKRLKADLLSSVHHCNRRAHDGRQQPHNRHGGQDPLAGEHGASPQWRANAEVAIHADHRQG